MKKDDIITLEDKKEYLILEIVPYNNVRYLYAVGVENEKAIKEYLFFKEMLENNEFYVETVEDMPLLVILKEEIQKKLKNQEQDV